MECRITQLGNMGMPEFGRILNRRAAGSIHLGKFSKWPTIPIEIPLQKGWMEKNYKEIKIYCALE